MLKKMILGFIICMIGSTCLTSCDPDEMDAFAEGYRYGYENSSEWKGDSTIVNYTNETINIEENAE